MRRQYPAEKKRRLVELVTSGEATVRKAARQLGVRPSTAYYWVRQAAKATAGAGGARSSPALAKTSVAAEPTFVQLVRSSAIVSSVEVRVGAAEILVKPGFDASLLRAVVEALGEDAE